MKVTRNDVLFVLSLALAIWFALTGMVWVYWAALIVAYPAGAISYLFWRIINGDNRRRNGIIPWILIAGLALSLGVLVLTD